MKYRSPTFTKVELVLSSKSWDWAQRCSLFKNSKCRQGQNSDWIAISHLAAICLRTPRLTCPPPLLLFLSPFILLAPLSLSPPVITLSLPAPRFISSSSNCSPPRHTWSQPAVSQYHLICSPLRLSGAQHPYRGLWGGKWGELTNVSTLCVRTSFHLAVSEHLAWWKNRIIIITACGVAF